MRTSAIHILYEPIYVIELKPLMKLAYIQTDDKSGNNFEMNMLRTELPKRGIAVEPFRKNEIFEEKIEKSPSISDIRECHSLPGVSGDW